VGRRREEEEEGEHTPVRGSDDGETFVVVGLGSPKIR
jgi:hypothetical protein